MALEKYGTQGIWDSRNIGLKEHTVKEIQALRKQNTRNLTSKKTHITATVA